MKNIAHFAIYAISGTCSHILMLIWSVLRPIAVAYYSSKFQQRLFALIARTRPHLLWLVLAACGGPLLLGYVWPGMPPAVLTFSLLSLLFYSALLHTLSRPSGLFHLNIVTHRRIVVHMGTPRAGKGRHSQFDELADVVLIAKKCNAKELVLDSPLLVLDATYQRVARRLTGLSTQAGVSATLIPEPPKPMCAAKSGLFAAFMSNYNALRPDRVVRVDRWRIMSRRIRLTLS